MKWVFFGLILRTHFYLKPSFSKQFCLVVNSNYIICSENIDNLALLLVVCNISSLFPLLFFNLIKDAGSQSEEQERESNESLTPPPPPSIMDVESTISPSQKGIIILPDKNR